jgi:hypothetical protein
MLKCTLMNIYLILKSHDFVKLCFLLIFRVQNNYYVGIENTYQNNFLLIKKGIETFEGALRTGGLFIYFYLWVGVYGVRWVEVGT